MFPLLALTLAVERIIYCPFLQLLQKLRQWKRILLPLRENIKTDSLLSPQHTPEKSPLSWTQRLHGQCLFCVSCEHQAIKTFLFTATNFYKIEICAIKSPLFFLCQHKWKCLPSYFPYTMGSCLPSLTLTSRNECSSSFCTYHWQRIPCLEWAAQAVHCGCPWVGCSGGVSCITPSLVPRQRSPWRFSS